MARHDDTPSAPKSVAATDTSWRRAVAQFLARNGAGLAVGLPVVAIIAVGFRSSWGALRDAALAAHMDAGGATLYPVAVDGLIAVAIVALLLLKDHAGPRRWCLTIIIAFTGASLLLNYLHGLGWFTPDPATKQIAPLPWWVIGVIALLVIGSIGLGSHLLVLVLRHAGRKTPDKPRVSRPRAPQQAPSPAEVKPRVRSVRASAAPANPRYEEAIEDCLVRLRAGEEMRSQKDLTAEYELSSDRQGRNAQNEARARFDQERLAAVNGRAPGGDAS